LRSPYVHMAVFDKTFELAFGIDPRDVWTDKKRFFLNSLSPLSLVSVSVVVLHMSLSPARLFRSFALFAGLESI
jgi:hypothetical protein